MYLSSRLLSAWKDRSPAHKYTGENLFFYGQVLSKLRSASKSMTLISLTLVLSTGPVCPLPRPERLGRGLSGGAGHL